MFLSGTVIFEECPSPLDSSFQPIFEIHGCLAILTIIVGLIGSDLSVANLILSHISVVDASPWYSEEKNKVQMPK